MESWLEGDINEVDLELPSPSKSKANPYYSVARHRAQQQIRNARGCQNLELKRQRLAAALEAANIAGVPHPVRESAEEELSGIKGAAKARQARTPTPEPPTYGYKPMRPVSPVLIHSLRNVQLEPDNLAYLVLRSDGIAELRDVANPRAAPAFSCRVFGSDALPVAVHSTVRDNDRKNGGRLGSFEKSSLIGLIECCEPFKAVVAVVDVLHSTGHLLCSQLLRRGPQGKLIGAIVACPGVDTPAPFSGPSYGAISALLCLGGEILGMGGFGWTGGGVFGQCLAFADRAVAYDGGWPSERLGDLAYRVAVAAESSHGPGGSKGPFLFGHGLESPKEIARAQSILAWLRGASQACHTTRAWVSHFLESGVRDGECNDGPMWLDAGLKCDRWPSQAPSKEEAIEAQEEQGEDDEEEQDEEAKKEAKAKAAAEEAAKKSAAREAAKAPFAGVKTEDLPLAPPLCNPIHWKSKITLSFGAEAAKHLSEVSDAKANCGFARLTDDSFPGTHLDEYPQGVEAVFVIDMSDPQIVMWPLQHWQQWAATLNKVGGVLAGVALLPAADAPEQEWYLALLALDVLINQFSFVVLIQDRSGVSLVLSALLDSSIPVRLAQAHLSPFPRLHFCVAYTSSCLADMLSNFDAAATISSIDLSALASPSTEMTRMVKEQFIQAGASEELIRAAQENVQRWLKEFSSQCGFGVAEEPMQSETKPSDEDGVENEDADQNEETEEAAQNEQEVQEEAPAESTAEPGVEDTAGETKAADEMVANEEVAKTGYPKATLLSFVIGDENATAALEEVLQVKGEQLVDGPLGPSLAFPLCSYGYGCVAPKPWGASWTAARKEVVVLAVQSRLMHSIFARVLRGLEEPPLEETAQVEQLEEERLFTEEVGQVKVEEEPANEGVIGGDTSDQQESERQEAAATKIQQAARARQARRLQADSEQEATEQIVDGEQEEKTADEQ